ncbi:MAG TPA: hypothetical protein VHF07_09325 [Nitrospiraceae bacterium]|nr:hypothetical protein [Nitrospiraceae bacterium]
MPKKSKIESDEARLKEKISAQWQDSSGDDPAFRSLRKRLKRIQRKRRATLARKARAAGKGVEGKSEGTAG